MRHHELRTPDVGNSGSVVPAPAKTSLDVGSPKIQAFEQRMGTAKNHDEKWKRTPTTTGEGAIHVRSFHCKLNGESMDFMDQQINEWLDAHPQYEVKLVSTSVGDWTGKTGKEPSLIVQVWV